MEKKEIKCQFYLDLDNLLEGELNEVCQKIQDIPNRLKKENLYVKEDPNVWIRFELGREYYGYEEGFELVVYGIRLETDEEFEKRKIKLQKQVEYKAKLKSIKEEKEKAQFERLKAKYGK